MNTMNNTTANAYTPSISETAVELPINDAIQAPYLSIAEEQVAADIAKQSEVNAETIYIQPQGPHFVIAEASVGVQHRNHSPHPLPCQDAVTAVISPRPILLACDGAGSARMSEIGSQAIATGIARLCQSIEPMLAGMLDGEAQDGDDKLLARIVIRHAIGLLEDLSIQHRRDVRDFRSTMNFAIVGKQRIAWVKVGDGEIIQEKLHHPDKEPEAVSSELNCIGELNKGEFDNQTVFIDSSLKFEDVFYGMFDAKDTTGLALMSDGATEKLVSNSRDKVAQQVGTWLDQVRHQKLKRGDICKRFYSEDFCYASTGDDRSIVLYARALE